MSGFAFGIWAGTVLAPDSFTNTLSESKAVSRELAVYLIKIDLEEHIGLAGGGNAGARVEAALNSKIKRSELEAQAQI
jgi:hypothetical protein